MIKGLQTPRVKAQEDKLSLGFEHAFGFAQYAMRIRFEFEAVRKYHYVDGFGFDWNLVAMCDDPRGRALGEQRTIHHDEVIQALRILVVVLPAERTQLQHIVIVSERNGTAQKIRFHGAKTLPARGMIPFDQLPPILCGIPVCGFLFHRAYWTYNRYNSTNDDFNADRPVEYSCRNSVRTGLWALFFFIILGGCSQKAAVRQSSSEVDRSALFGLSGDREKDRAFFGNVGRPSLPDHDDKTSSRRGKFKTVWEHIFSLYAFPPVQHPQIYQDMDWFLRHPDYLDRVQQRAEPYLYEIIDQIEKQRIPGEFALLPVIESAFQPYAYSRAHASGIWQFIPSTGLRYGLQQDWWYDGRRDIYAATQAAIRYLRKLNGDFGDWLLALAAYNCGEGAVQNAIDRNLRNDQPTDFWSLKLPAETRGYVPRLLAIAKLFANAKRYGIHLRPIPDRPYFKTITVASQIDLKMAAELAGISMHKLYELNPGYNQWATAPHGPHRLLIPMENAKLFSERIDNLSDLTRVQWRRHRVNPGDSLESIADIYGSSVANIQRANNLVTASLETGSHLIVPMTDKELLHYNFSPNPNMPKRSLAKRSVWKRVASKRGFSKRFVRRGRSLRSSKKTFYTVRRGDTLTNIARRYSLNSRDLAKWNRLGKKSKLLAGTKIALLSRAEVSKPKSKYSRSKTKLKKSASKRYSKRRTTKAVSKTKLARVTKVSAKGRHKVSSTGKKGKGGKVSASGRKSKARR